MQRDVSVADLPRPFVVWSGSFAWDALGCACAVRTGDDGSCIEHDESKGTEKK